MNSTRNWMIFVIFIGGLLCGYALTQFVGQRAESPTQPSTARQDAPVVVNDSDASAALPQGAPTTADLYDKVLPHTSSAWLWVDLDRLNQPNERFETLMSEEPIALFFQQFASTLPQGATQAAENLFGQSQSARIFSLPPERRGPAFPFLAAFTKPDANLSDVHRLIREPFLQIQPEMSVNEVEVGPYRLFVFETEIGELGYLYDQGIIWTTNHSEAFSQMLSVPAPDALAQAAPHRQWLVEYPDIMAGLFINAAGRGVEAMGAPGQIPLFMANMGVTSAAALLKFTNGEGRLTILAHAENTPEWVEEWPVVERYLFRSSDPAGMLEVTMNWPNTGTQLPTSGGFGGPGSGDFGARARGGGFMGGPDGAIAFNPPEGFTPPEGITPGGGEERGAAFRGEGARGQREGGQRGGAQRGGAGDGAFMQEMGARQERGGGARTFNLFNRLIPPGRDVGFNLFGFNRDAPAMTIATPELDPSTSFVGRLATMPMVEDQLVEIAMLPGSRYILRESPMVRGMGLDELVVIERDAVTYLFDAESAAQYYFDEQRTTSVGERSLSADLRRLLEMVRTPAQIEGILTPDLLQWILQLEKGRFPTGSVPYAELEELGEALKSYMMPMAFSAGFEDEHWFLEAATPDDAGMVVDLAVLMLGLTRWFYGG